MAGRGCRRCRWQPETPKRQLQNERRGHTCQCGRVCPRLHLLLPHRERTSQISPNPAKVLDKGLLGGTARPSKPPCFFPTDQSEWYQSLRPATCDLWPPCLQSKQQPIDHLAWAIVTLHSSAPKNSTWLMMFIQSIT